MGAGGVVERHLAELGLRRPRLPLAVQELIHRSDGDLHLRLVGIARRQRLQQQPRRDDRLHERAVRVLAAEAQQLVGDPRDDGNQQDSREHPQPQVGRAQQGEQHHRNRHDFEQERRPAAGMSRWILRHVRRVQRIVVLPGVNSHVFGAVISVDTLHIRHGADQRNVADQQAQTDQTLGQVAPEAAGAAKDVLGNPDDSQRRHEEDADTKDERDAPPWSTPAVYSGWPAPRRPQCQPPTRGSTSHLRLKRDWRRPRLPSGQLDIGREHERLHPQAEGVPQQGHAADERDLLDDAAVEVAGQRPRLHLDAAIGGTHRDRHERPAAHHHPLQNGLTAVRDLRRSTMRCAGSLDGGLGGHVVGG